MPAAANDQDMALEGWAFASAPLGVSILLGDNRIGRVNPALCDMLQRTPDDLLGAQLDALVHPADLPELQELQTHLGRSFSARSIELRLLRAEGRKLSVRATLLHLRQHRDQPNSWMLLFEDLNTLDQDDFARHRISQLIDLVQTEAYVLDVHAGHFLYANHSALKSLGYSLQELRKLTPLDMLDGLDESSFQKMIAPITNGERDALRLQVVHRRRDDSTYPARVNLQVARDSHPPVVLILAEDISEERLTQQALQRNEAHLQLAQQVANVGSWYLHVASGRVWWSDQTYRIFGNPDLPEPTLDDFMRFVHPDDLDLLREHWRSAMAGAEFNLEFRILVDGQVRHVHEAAQMDRNNKGHVLEATGTVQDITELKSLQAQLVQAQKMEAIGQLTAGIAHDFNNLLQVILGHADLLEHDQPPGPGAAHAASQIRRAAEHAAQLTNALLTFGSRQTLHSKSLDLCAEVPRLEHLLSRTLGPHIRLSVQLPATSVRVLADPTLLESALLNLAINARDAIIEQQALHGRSSGRLQLLVDSVDRDAQASAPGPGRYGRVRVRDNGIGMNAAVRQRAFEPFFTTKAVGKGSGLGLSMVYGFARQSDGGVELDSSPGEGTTVSLLLPLAPLDPTDTGHAADQPPAGRPGT